MLEAKIKNISTKFDKDEKDFSLNLILDELNLMDTVTYNHSLRMEEIGTKAGEVLGVDPEMLAYFCRYHDVGKIEIDQRVLIASSDKSIDFEKDASLMERMKNHAKYSHELLKDIDPFLAGVALYHHQFQPKPYPGNALEILTESCPKEELENIKLYSRYVSIIDAYDSMTLKDNGRSKPTTREGIKNRLIEIKPNSIKDIEKLYDAGIFE